MCGMENKLEAFFMNDCIKGTIDVFNSKIMTYLILGVKTSVYKSNDTND